MAKIPAMLCLDIEDPITMRSHLAAQWITEEITKADLKASCFLVAEKVRAWERLGLREVIEAVKRHDLAFHSSRHSFHPTISEISEALPAQAGAEMLYGWERPGWEEAERIMGKPINHWGLTGSSWSPALAVMLARRGHAVLYSPIYGQDKSRPCWFAGGLNLADFFGGLDPHYHNDEQFEAAFARHREALDQRIAAGAPYVAPFCCHPTRVVHHEFWDDVNFSAGRITVPEQWQDPPAITPEQEQTARKNMRAYLQWIASEERIEIIGTSELVELFAVQKAGCTPQQFLEICQRIADQQQVIFTDSFTAAEILGMMVQYAANPDVDFLVRQDLMGPENLPTQASASEFSYDAVLTAAPVVATVLQATRKLPELVNTTTGPVYIADYFVALARAILLRQADAQESLSVAAEMPYPAVGDELTDTMTSRVEGWLHRPDLDLQWIQRDTRLLSWTYKPAWTEQELARLE